VGDELLNLSEVTVEPRSRLIDWSIEKLEEELDLSVVCYRGENVTDLHPDSDLRLSSGDTILVIASIETLGRLNDLNLVGTG
jgi:Trk K+ transport system NAD-binding subunit